jgi:hypothetical protein
LSPEKEGGLHMGLKADLEKLYKGIKKLEKQGGDYAFPVFKKEGERFNALMDDLLGHEDEKKYKECVKIAKKCWLYLNNGATRCEWNPAVTFLAGKWGMRPH